MSDELPPADEGAPVEPSAEDERVHTGDDRVDSVVDEIAALQDRPLDEHAAVFESAHERLRRALDDHGSD